MNYLAQNCEYFLIHQFKTPVVGAQKNHLIKKVLSSTHNICFGWEIRNLIFKYKLLSKGLITKEQSH